MMIIYYYHIYILLVIAIVFINNYDYYCYILRPMISKENSDCIQTREWRLKIIAGFAKLIRQHILNGFRSFNDDANF